MTSHPPTRFAARLATRLVVLVAGTSLLAGGAAAEVRLVEGVGAGGDAVQVTPTPQGAWTPLDDLVGDEFLNPAGDVIGDGFPTWSTSSEGTFVAWARPASGQVMLARAGDGAWQVPLLINAIAPVGTPRLLVSRDALVVAWQSMRADVPVTELALVDVHGHGVRLRGETLEIDGVLQGVARTGDTAHVVVIDDGRLIDVILNIPIPPIQPERSFEVELSALAAPSVEAWLDAASRLHALPSGPVDAFVLTWWSGPRELSFVELGEAGPSLPVETLTAQRGPERPEGLVRQALRLVRQRF